MRILFILIVIGAAGYLGYTHKDELLAKVSEIQQSRSGNAEPAKDDAGQPAAAPNSNAPSAPLAPLAPGEKRLAPPGVFYVTTRVSIQQDSGIKALNAGEQVKMMYHNNDGTARVAAGKYDFIVKESLLTNDLDVAQRLAAAAPAP